MDEKEFNNRINELIKIAAKIPCELTEENYPKESNIDSKINESLSKLRICIKYLLLEIEATTRERDKLKKILEDNNDEPNKMED